MTRTLVRYVFFLPLFLLFLTPPLFARQKCQKDADCNDNNSCTSDSCSNGICFQIVTCIGAVASPTPEEIPVNQAALSECLKTCLDEPCWDASCTNDGQCFKMATCIGASAPPPPPPLGGVLLVPRPPSSVAVPPPLTVPLSPVVPLTPSTPPATPPSPPASPPPPPPPPSPPPAPPPPPFPPVPDGVPPPGGEKIPNLQRPDMKRCEDLAGVMRACCLQYDDPAQGGNGDGVPNKLEIAQIIKDESCRPPREPGSGPPSPVPTTDFCANLANIMVGEGAKVTLNGFQQCCQTVRNVGDMEGVTVRQSCENVGLEAPTGFAREAGAPSAPAKALTASESESPASADGGCRLIR